ncbi:putative membrane protein YphA (DoxX/SURF4 family) [Fontibacillus solani]|uniref:Putative membrane protein YphA (DoxX/SURF4 family) n=1 Tax=Fontibacillus solani TaxID=1572857 RepID=A0A7W3STF0_9BACL|nr:MauE/DoxX family redox-associated membrane protein [Fontibacillus solani]MBA9085703.1 putative membrane protein YphA (DoxX/SURF4 family) [Fontibacillus solani]
MDLRSLVLVFLIVVFLLSSLGKFLNIKSFRETMIQLRIPYPWSGIGTIGVPIAELLACILLLIPSIQLYGQLLILLLLASFIWASWRARGRSVDCNCFGGIVGEQFGRMTYLRICAIFILDMVLFLTTSNTALLEFSLIEMISAILTSIGIIVIYSLLVLLQKYNSVHEE